MKVSIAMATYNGAEYLQDQLDSFINQTRLPDELVIIDDCSADNTLEIITEFSKKAPFEVFFSVNNKNLGYTGNFNEALTKTTGDIIFLSDQDDVWLPDKIRIVTEAAIKNPQIMVVMNDAYLTDDQLNKIGCTKLDQILSSGQHENGFVMGCCCAVRKEFLDICLPIPRSIRGHDNWIVGFAARMERRLVLPDVLQLYRRHQNNESKYIANSTKKITKIIALIEEVKKVTALKNNESYVDSLEQARIMRDFAGRLAGKHDFLKEDFERVRLKLSSKVFVMERRIKIRETPAPRRIASAFFFAVEGGYKGSNWLKKFIRDCYG